MTKYKAVLIEYLMNYPPLRKIMFVLHPSTANRRLTSITKDITEGWKAKTGNKEGKDMKMKASDDSRGMESKKGILCVLFY